jgi:hypothetical protein
MRLRVLDLDGSLIRQSKLLTRHRPLVVPLRQWGPRLRLGCRWKRFLAFEELLDHRLRRVPGIEPWVTFCGSGDFHHLSLTLLRRLRGPCNLLVIDKHPDWMRGIPFLHCGTWLHHAARLPQVRNIFHVGGEADFDNAYRWLAPTPLLRSGRLTVFPAARRFHAGFWDGIRHEPLRARADRPVTAARLEKLVDAHRDVLRGYPLYVSLDKDVLTAAEAPVNWDSGHLDFEEVRAILDVFRSAAGHRLAGADVVGDWSPVIAQGWFRSLLHRVEHPALQIEPHHAAECNQNLNLALAEFFTSHLSLNLPWEPQTNAAA